jgi:hypothetical protein
MKNKVRITTLLFFILSFASSCKEDSDTSNSVEENGLTQLEFSYKEIMKWDGSRVFTDPSNPFKKTIPQDAQVHQNSEEMIDLIKSKCGADLSNTFISAGSYAIPIYIANKDCDERTVRMTLYHPPKKTKLLHVPIPQGAKAASASDMHMGIIDPESNCLYEFWRYSSFTAGSGNAISLETDGIYKDGRSTVAAGWSQIQGIIWPKELNDGVINHALSFSTPVTNKNGYVPPATKNDGTLTDNPFAIPEGTLIRIKPSVDLDTLSGISEIERIVYRAIQKYGMYCGDTNGAGLAIRAVGTSSLPEGAYPSSFEVRPQSGNYYLRNFPFEHLEVIYTGELTKIEFREYINHGCANWEQ